LEENYPPKSKHEYQTPSGTKPKRDTVKLSGTARAKSLKLQGLTPPQIAAQMGLDQNTIDSYLGISG
jgi:hypothetical protein